MNRNLDFFFDPWSIVKHVNNFWNANAYRILVENKCHHYFIIQNQAELHNVVKQNVY